MLKIENFSQSDEKAVVDLWNRTLKFDQISLEKFRRQALLDDNFDSKKAFVAKEGEKTIGFAFATKRIFPYLERGLEPEKAWLNVIFVDKSHRRRGVGTKLLKCCEQAVSDGKTRDIIFAAYSPSYFFYGIDKKNCPEAAPFFESCGYNGAEDHFSMGKNLHFACLSAECKQKIAELKQKSYEFAAFRAEQALELLSFLRDEFGGGWKRNALLAMQKGDAEDRILLALHNGKICGFCMRGIDGNPMRFGPIGVAKSERNAGLGGALLELYLQEMAKRGIYRAFFVTTDEPGRRYYERHGFELIRIWTSYSKNLQN